MKFLCLGDYGVDHYLESDLKGAGGCSFNVAWHLQNLGQENPQKHPVSLFTAMGTDEYLSFVEWHRRHLDVRWRVSTYSGKTPLQKIKLWEDGEKNFCGYDGGILKKFCLDADDLNFIHEHDLCVSVLYRDVEPLFMSWFDLDPKIPMAIDFMNLEDYDLEHPLVQKLIPHLKYAFFGLNESDKTRLEKLSNLSSIHKTCFVATLGDRGVQIFKQGQQWKYPAKLVGKVVDTTGAGDSFIASFLYFMAEGFSLAESADRALSYSARIVQQIGSTFALVQPARITPASSSVSRL